MPFVRFLGEESALEPRYRSLLLLRTAWLTHSQYHWSVFASTGREAGLTDVELRRIAVGPDADAWSDFEAAHLRLADELYRNSSVTDRTWTTLGIRYNLLQMVEAVMNVNEFTLLSMMFNSMGVQPDVWSTDRLPTDVPYRISTPDPEPPLRRPRIAPLHRRGTRCRWWSPFSVTLLTLADELYSNAMVSDETWGLVSMSLNAFGVQILTTDERLPDVR